MERRRISSGSPWEPVVGLSRAVVAGDDVFVSATAAVMPNDADPPATTYGQARCALDIVLEALSEAGAGPQHVVRTRIYLTPAADVREAALAHGEVFGAARPASGIIIVAGFADPRWLVEFEAHARLD